MNGFRIFLSYAHADIDRIERIDLVLRDMGLIPIWDKDIPVGRVFDDVIRSQIARAHVFMPLLTLNSVGRPWVHQEIGYALGIGVTEHHLLLLKLADLAVSDSEISNRTHNQLRPSTKFM